MSTIAGAVSARAPPLPIVAHLEPLLGTSDRRRAERLAGKLRAVDPLIGSAELFGPGADVGAQEGPTLHVHDAGRSNGVGLAYALEHRGFLLAGDGDVVVLGRQPVRAFRDHCREDLRLGSPAVLVPAHGARPMPLSLRCARDVQAMQSLVALAREHGRLTVAPYLATGDVWALAGALARASGASVRVSGPPPRLSRLVNDKIWFAHRVEELLGEHALPVTTSARGWAVLAHRVRACARRYPSVGIKLPSASGASGNFVIDSSVVRRLPSLHAVATELRRLVRHLGWHEPFPMLVSVWEESVLVTPSVQLWIPMRGEGDPVVEGVFDQTVEPEAGKFVGCAPSRLDREVRARIAYEAVLLGVLFQELGYFGRCSFDSILVGDRVADAELHWIECNGRWGGTSIPMTLANRLVADWMERPFVVIGSVRGAELSSLEAIRAVARDRDRIFDPRSGTGLIFLSPAQAETGKGLDLMSMGGSLRGARRLASEALDLLGGSTRRSA